jgi:hypothetical protein
MVEEMDDAIGQLVLQCCWIQEARLEVRASSEVAAKISLAVGPYNCSQLRFGRTCANDCILLRADDLIPEESETVLLALKRLPQKEAYDRVFRLRRAFQVRLGLIIECYWSIGLTIYSAR